MTSASRVQAGLPRVLDLIASSSRHLLGGFRRRRVYATLEKLDDRMLRDVGLSRWDVVQMRRHW